MALSDVKKIEKIDVYKNILRNADKKRKAKRIILTATSLAMVAGVAAAPAVALYYRKNEKYEIVISSEISNFKQYSIKLKRGSTIATLREKLDIFAGHVLEGIFKDEECTIPYKNSDKISKDKTVYLKYSKENYSITLPQSEAYTIIYSDSVDINKIPYESSFEFRVELNESYSGSNLTVKANGEVLVPSNGWYAIDFVDSNLEIEISGIRYNIYEINSIPSQVTVLDEDGNELQQGDEITHGDLLTITYQESAHKVKTKFEVTGATLVSNNSYKVNGNLQIVYSEVYESYLITVQDGISLLKNGQPITANTQGKVSVQYNDILTISAQSFDGYNCSFSILGNGLVENQDGTYTVVGDNTTIQYNKNALEYSILNCPDAFVIRQNGEKLDSSRKIWHDDILTIEYNRTGYTLKNNAFEVAGAEKLADGTYKVNGNLLIQNYVEVPNTYTLYITERVEDNIKVYLADKYGNLTGDEITAGKNKIAHDQKLIVIRTEQLNYQEGVFIVNGVSYSNQTETAIAITVAGDVTIIYEENRKTVEFDMSEIPEYIGVRSQEQPAIVYKEIGQKLYNKVILNLGDSLVFYYIEEDGYTYKLLLNGELAANEDAVIVDSNIDNLTVEFTKTANTYNLTINKLNNVKFYDESGNIINAGTNVIAYGQKVRVEVTPTLHYETTFNINSIENLISNLDGTFTVVGDVEINYAETRITQTLDLSNIDTRIQVMVEESGEVLKAVDGQGTVKTVNRGDTLLISYLVEQGYEYTFVVNGEIIEATEHSVKITQGLTLNVILVEKALARSLTMDIDVLGDGLVELYKEDGTTSIQQGATALEFNQIVKLKIKISANYTSNLQVSGLTEQSRIEDDEYTIITYQVADNVTVTYTETRIQTEINLSMLPMAVKVQSKETNVVYKYANQTGEPSVFLNLGDTLILSYEAQEGYTYTFVVNGIEIQATEHEVEVTEDLELNVELTSSIIVYNISITAPENTVKVYLIEDESETEITINEISYGSKIKVVYSTTTGYYPNSFIVNGTAIVGNDTFIIDKVTSDVEITYEESIYQYALTIPQGVTVYKVDAQGNIIGNALSTGDEIVHGDKLQIAYTLEENKCLVKFEVNGETFENNGTITVSNNVVVVFEQDWVSYNITIPENVTINGQTAGQITVKHNDILTIEHNIIEGYTCSISTTNLDKIGETNTYKVTGEPSVIFNKVANSYLFILNCDSNIDFKVQRYSSEGLLLDEEVLSGEEIKHDEILRFAYTSTEGYELKTFKINNVDSDISQEITVEGNIEIIFEETEIKYSITNNFSQITLVYYNDEYTQGETLNFGYGDTITVYFTPSVGKQMTSCVVAGHEITENGQVIGPFGGDNSSVYTITYTEEDIIYSLTNNSSEDVQVTLETDNELTYGDIITLSYIGEEGYNYNFIVEGATELGNNQYQVTGNVTISCELSLKDIAVTKIYSENSIEGEDPISIFGTFKFGETITISWEEVAGVQRSVILNGEEVENGSTITLTEDIVLNCVNEYIWYSISIPSEVAVTRNGETLTSISKVKIGDVLTISYSNVEYFTTGVKVNGTDLQTILTDSIYTGTFTVGNEDVVITFEKEQIYYTISGVEKLASVTVDGEEITDGRIAAGSTLNFTHYASEGIGAKITVNYESVYYGREEDTGSILVAGNIEITTLYKLYNEASEGVDYMSIANISHNGDDRDGWLEYIPASESDDYRTYTFTVAYGNGENRAAIRVLVNGIVVSDYEKYYDDNVFDLTGPVRIEYERFTLQSIADYVEIQHYQNHNGSATDNYTEVGYEFIYGDLIHITNYGPELTISGLVNLGNGNYKVVGDVSIAWAVDKYHVAEIPSGVNIVYNCGDVIYNITTSSPLFAGQVLTISGVDVFVDGAIELENNQYQVTGDVEIVFAITLSADRNDIYQSVYTIQTSDGTVKEFSYNSSTQIKQGDTFRILSIGGEGWVEEYYSYISEINVSGATKNADGSYTAVGMYVEDDGSTVYRPQVNISFETAQDITIGEIPEGLTIYDGRTQLYEGSIVRGSTGMSTLNWEINKPGYRVTTFEVTGAYIYDYAGDYSSGVIRYGPWNLQKENGVAIPVINFNVEFEQIVYSIATNFYSAEQDFKLTIDGEEYYITGAMSEYPPIEYGQTFVISDIYDYYAPIIKGVTVTNATLVSSENGSYTYIANGSGSVIEININSVAGSTLVTCPEGVTVKGNRISGSEVFFKEGDFIDISSSSSENFERGITISYTLTEGYKLKTFTVNGIEFENGGTYTIDGNDINIVFEQEEITYKLSLATSIGTDCIAEILVDGETIKLGYNGVAETINLKRNQTFKIIEAIVGSTYEDVLGFRHVVTGATYDEGTGLYTVTGESDIVITIEGRNYFILKSLPEDVVVNGGVQEGESIGGIDSQIIVYNYDDANTKLLFNGVEITAPDAECPYYTYTVGADLIITKVQRTEFVTYTFGTIPSQITVTTRNGTVLTSGSTFKEGEILTISYTLQEGYAVKDFYLEIEGAQTNYTADADGKIVRQIYGEPYIVFEQAEAFTFVKNSTQFDTCVAKTEESEWTFGSTLAVSQKIVKGDYFAICIPNSEGTPSFDVEGAEYVTTYSSYYTYLIYQVVGDVSIEGLFTLESNTSGYQVYNTYDGYNTSGEITAENPEIFSEYIMIYVGFDKYGDGSAVTVTGGTYYNSHDGYEIFQVTGDISISEPSYDCTITSIGEGTTVYFVTDHSTVTNTQLFVNSGVNYGDYFVVQLSSDYALLRVTGATQQSDSWPDNCFQVAGDVVITTIKREECYLTSNTSGLNVYKAGVSSNTNWYADTDSSISVSSTVLYTGDYIAIKEMTMGENMPEYAVSGANFEYRDGEYSYYQITGDVEIASTNEAVTEVTLYELRFDASEPFTYYNISIYNQTTRTYLDVEEDNIIHTGDVLVFTYTYYSVGDGSYEEFKEITNFKVNGTAVASGSTYTVGTEDLNVTFELADVDDYYILNDRLEYVNREYAGEVVLGPSVTNIGDYAFQSCSGPIHLIIEGYIDHADWKYTECITELTIREGACIYEGLYDDLTLECLTIEDGNQVYSFYNYGNHTNSSIERIEILKSAMSIDISDFEASYTISETDNYYVLTPNM